MQIPCRLDNVLGVSGNMEGIPPKNRKKLGLTITKPETKKGNGKGGKINE